MSKPADTWMPLYIADYLADTMHLNHAQHGIYLLLIMAYWRTGTALPDDADQLAAVSKCSAMEWRKHRPVIEKFFHIEEGLWCHKRIDEELAEAKRLTKARSKAGAKGAAKRWQTDGKANDKMKAKSLAKSSQNDAPSPSQSEGEEGEASRTNLNNLTSETNSAREESEGFFKKIAGDPSGRSAPLAADAALKEKRRNLLISKVTRFATAKIADPEVAIAGLMGDDPEHDEQWWLDHLDHLMRAQHWDDTTEEAA